jgi:hypothetical protein
MKKVHDISNVKVEREFLFLTIDGKDMHFRVKAISSVLHEASEEERNTFDISPSGYGIHWPLIDEDISVDGLLGIEHKPQWKRRIA